MIDNKNKVQFRNTNSLPIIGCPTAITLWPQEEMKATDVKTKRLKMFREVSTKSERSETKPLP